MSPWAWLLTAGAAEVAWSQSIRPTDGFTRLGPTILCVALAIAAMFPLTHAMKELPVGTAYSVFTGIGAVGAVGLGIATAGDPVNLPRLTGLALITGGVVMLRVAGEG